jgi:BirA family biotin operon repressor/biotin-[acetyl-CoA-carboxylase] ligase
LLQQGVAAGVDQLGRLLLRSDGGLQEIMSGDVSLRLTGE